MARDRTRRGDADIVHRDLRWRAAVIVLAGALTYANSLSGALVLDDAAAIVGNRSIRQLSNLGEVLFPERDSSVAGRPLVNLSLAVNYAVGGLDVRGYHVWNLAVHLLCGLALFGLVRRTLRAPLVGCSRSDALNIGFASALIWTLHPLNSEVVDYLTQRTESMMALGYLLTMYFSVRSVSQFLDEEEDARRETWQRLAVTSCVLGMLCKETMVTAPIAVALYDRCFVFGSFRAAIARRWRFYAALAAAWIPLALSVGSGPRAAVVGFTAGVSPWTYLLNQAVMLVHYLKLAVWPTSLVAFYGWPLPLTLGDVLPQALLVVVLIVATIAALAWRPACGFAGAWFFLTLAPSSSVVPITTEVGAERRMYLALAAVVVLAVAGVVQAARVVVRRWAAGPDAARTSTIAGGLALAAVAVALAATTAARNREYGSALELARTVVERRPTSIAHHYFGTELMTAGRLDEAVAHLRQAVPGDSRAQYDLGLALFTQGRLDESVSALRAYVATFRLPYRLVPSWLEPPLGEVMTAHATMAKAFAAKQRWGEMTVEAQAMLALVPASVEGRGLLAQALYGQQRFAEAVSQFQQYLRSRPDDFSALTSMGVALVASGRAQEAMAVFQRAVEVNPRSPDARRNLATALYDARRFDEAAAQAEEATRLKPDDAAAHDLLGRSLAMQGRFDDAQARFERAIAIDPNGSDAREDLRRLQVLRDAARK